MAFNKRTWKGRQGTGLNKFSIDGATPVTVVNQPDSLIEAGDALSAGNLNDLETRIDNAFNAVDAEVATKADETEVTDLKNALQATNARVENLEEAQGGYYEVTTKSPYTIPSGKAKNWRVDVLRGVTRARNHLVSSLVSSPEVYGITRTSIGDGKLRYSGICTYSTNFTTASITNFVAGHVYLIYLNSVLPTGTRLDLASNDRDNIFMGVLNNVSSFGVEITANGTNYDFTVQPIVRDLNVYFGGTIPSDAQTIADIQTNYPELLVPSEYGTSFVSTRYEGVRSIGVNIWDEEWEIGNYGGSGEKISGSSLINKNMIPVLPSTSYYFYEGFSPAYHNVLYYDSNGNFISIDTSDVTAFTTPSNCYFMNFALALGYGNSYRNDITIAKGSTAVTYHPYVEPSTLSLPSPVTLRSAGSVAEEYDLESGEVTHPLNEVDLSTLNWAYAGDGLFYVSGADSWLKFPATSTEKANMICTRYITESYNDKTFTDKIIYTSWQTAGVKLLYISDTSYSDATALKNSLSGVMLRYEAVTPNESTQLNPIQNPYLPTEAGGTISSILTTKVDDSMTLGYINL